MFLVVDVIMAQTGIMEHIFLEDVHVVLGSHEK